LGQLVLGPVYETLADAYLTQASELQADGIGSEAWQKKKAAYENATNFFTLAADTPSGFASDDARVLSRLAEADEGSAQMDVQEIPEAAPEHREALARERDELWSGSDASMRRAKDILIAANVPATDSNYRTVILDWGNTVFGREAGASDDEKAKYYREALRRYEDAAQLLPNDPRPLLYQGLCHERLTAIAKSADERQREFALAEGVLRRALAISSDAPDYNPGLPYKELAVLYSHVNDYASALQALKRAREANVDPTQEPTLTQEIRSVEEFLAGQQKGK
jgi:tetratricopeptide (TPR) repeat protein